MSVHTSCGGIIYKKNVNGEVEVLLLHRFKSPTWAYDSWHLPKGTKDGEESDEETVRREVFEETGYRVMVKQKVGMLESEKEGEIKQKETVYYLCEVEVREKDLVTEHDEVAWVPLQKAIELVSAFPIYEKEEIILQKAGILL